MVVADVDGLTVLVDVWGLTDDELAGWLPAAMAFVNSIDFYETVPSSPSPQPTSPLRDFLRPFTYSLPAGEPVLLEPVTSHMFRFADSDDVARRGVAVAIVGVPWVHDCPSDGHSTVRKTPSGLLSDLEASGGIELTEARPDNAWRAPSPIDHPNDTPAPQLRRRPALVGRPDRWRMVNASNQRANRGSRHRRPDGLRRHMGENRCRARGVASDGDGVRQLDPLHVTALRRNRASSRHSASGRGPRDHHPDRM